MNTKIVIDKVYRLFAEPTVYLTSGSVGMDAVVKHGIPGSTCLINLIWAFGPRSLPIYAPRLRAMRNRGIAPIVLGSSQQDMFYLRLCGIPCAFVNQNQFLLEENIPVRSRETNFDFDAFYAAQAKTFKRMHLASDVQRLYILTYGWPGHLNHTRNLGDFEPRVQHAMHNKTYLDFAEISTLMHRSACALALSRKEGAMWAASEALLSGLPVVSTASKGGRDRYFDPRTVKLVAAKSSAVAAAVDMFRASPPDPLEVRRITLEKMMKDRRETVRFMRERVLANTAFTNDEIYSRLFKDGEARTALGL